METSKTERIFGLDVLRGFLAIGIVIFHWRMMVSSEMDSLKISIRDFPFFSYLSSLYQFGDLGVQIFFTISGFVFFKFYASQIINEEIGFVHFLYLRFTRIYPLHLLSLLLVLILQWYYFSLSGRYFYYPNQDVQHFILQLYLASNWGVQEGFSFNGPSWSISVEWALYIIFYVFNYNRRIGTSKYILLLLLPFLGFLSVKVYGLFIGIKAFFLGGVIVYFDQLTGIKTGIKWAISGFTFLVAILMIVSLGADFSLKLFAQKSILNEVLDYRLLICFGFVSFFLYLESYLERVFKRLSYFGDLSFSIYLLHFPLQLVVMISLKILHVPATVVLNPLFFLTFFAVLISISHFSYHYFERPIQQYLRARFSQHSKKVLTSH